MSNSLDPDLLSGLVWVQTVCKSYQQTTLVDEELRAAALKFCMLIKDGEITKLDFKGILKTITGVRAHQYHHLEQAYKYIMVGGTQNFTNTISSNGLD